MCIYKTVNKSIKSLLSLQSQNCVNRLKEKKFKILSWIVLTSIVIITGFLVYQTSNTTLNYNFEEFYPADDPESEYFYEHRERFESDNDFILISIANKGGVFQEDFLNKVNQYSEALKTVPHVRDVRSLTQEKERFIYATRTTGKRPYINFEDIDLVRDSTTIFKNTELINTLISENGKALAILVKHEELLGKQKSDEIVTALYELTDEYDFEEIRFAGRTIGQIFYVQTMFTEMSTYVGLSMILVVFFLLIAFRSAWGLLVPQVVIVGSMLWIVGFMGWVREPLNILLTILPSIMFVVSMSDVIHLVSKYLELLREGNSKFEAIKISFKEIGMATFLTSLTTSIGFFSLVFVNVIPIQTFGLYVGIGVLMAFILTFSTLPFLFYYTKKPKVIKNESKNFWLPVMRNAFLYTMRNRKWLPWFSLVVVAVFAFGATKIVANNYIMDDIKEDVSMKQDFNYFDANFGGVRPFELTITLKDTNQTFWDVELLQEIERVEIYLRDSFEVDLKTSLVQTLSILNRASHAGDSAYFEVPKKKSKLRKLKRIIKIAEEGQLVRLFLNESETITRISGTVPDWGNIESTKRNKALKAFIASEIDAENLEFTLTGSAHLLDKNMSYMSTSLVQGLAFATLVVAILMGLLYRSLRMVVISIIPNLIPLLIIAGIMGYFGINLKITTAIVFTISFGIAVDDTIHFLSKFKLELNKGKSVIYALKRTYLGTGKAIVLTSAILCSGFLLLLFSDFLGTFYLGLMISITLLFAVLADLFLLPLLLLYFFKRKN